MSCRDTNWGDVEMLGPHHVSTLPRYWFTRLYVALGVVMSILVACWEPDALTYRLIAQSGEFGFIVVAILTALSVTAIADVIVNDLLPERFVLPSVKRKRHFVYIALSISIFSLCYVFIVAEGSGFRPLILPFCLDGLVAAIVAFLDLFQRHRGPQ